VTLTTGSFHPGIAQQVGRDRALVRQLEALAGGEGLMLVHASRAWASITFAGSRHSFTWAFDGRDAVEAGEAMIAALPDHEFSVPGHLVADAAVGSAEQRADPPRLVVEFEILLLEDA
jgi:hypothetical protein